MADIFCFKKIALKKNLFLYYDWPPSASPAPIGPGLALKEGRPFLSFAVQGGDTQDQNLLQFFLDVVEFGLNVQQACEAPNITSYQMHDSFAAHKIFPGKLDINESVPPDVRKTLEGMGYLLSVKRYTSGPINAIWFDAAPKVAVEASRSASTLENLTSEYSRSKKGMKWVSMKESM